MKELLPALLCIFIMLYVIYLEFKNPKYNRDMFVDLSISIIIMIVGIYSMYEYKFDIKVNAVKAYIGLLALGVFYVCLVFYHEKHPKKQEEVKEEQAEKEDSPVESENSEEK